MRPRVPACCMDSSGMRDGGGESWLSQTPEPLPRATLRVTAASREMSWQWFVLRQTFHLSLLPCPPLLSAVWRPQAALEKCALPGHSPMHQEWGLRPEFQGATEGLHRGPCSVRAWKIQACFSPPRQEKGLSTTPGLACTWSGGPSFHKYLLSTALCKHHGRHVNTVVNGTAALAFPFDVKRTLFKMCDSMASNTFTGVRPSPLSISVAVSSSPRKSPRAFGGHSQSPLHLQPGALRGSACSTRVV